MKAKPWVIGVLAAGLVFGGAAWAQNVKITPLGSHAGELCERDRATLFEDPTGGVRFKLRWSNLAPYPPLYEEEVMGMSDETLLNRLNGHPELRSRVESMLLVVGDEMGNLQEADAAELRLIEEMRRMGQESLQAWASGQAAKSAEAVGSARGTWRGGKKNSAGTAPLAKSP